MMRSKQGLRRTAWLYTLLAVTLATPSYSQQQPPSLAFRLDVYTYLTYNGRFAENHHYVSDCGENSYNFPYLDYGIAISKNAGQNTVNAVNHFFTRGSAANARQEGTGSSLTVYALGPTGTHVHFNWTRTGQASVSGAGPTALARSVGGALAQLPVPLSNTSNESQMFDGVTGSEVSCGGSTYSYALSIPMDNTVATDGNCVGCTADAVTTVNVSSMPCEIPTGEEFQPLPPDGLGSTRPGSITSGWETAGQTRFYIGFVFAEKLQGGNFSGMRVQEFDAPGYIPTSNCPNVPSSGVSGDHWDIGDDNLFADENLIDAGVVVGVQAQLAPGQKCSLTSYQQMKIWCPDINDWIPYGPVNTIGETIYKDHVEFFRAGITLSKRWPPR